MILLGIPCKVCESPTVAHCGDAKCGWNRCPRCHSYGYPNGAWVKWNANDYRNPYSLLDVETAEPERTFPVWLAEDYGTKRECDGPGPA